MSNENPVWLPARLAWNGLGRLRRVSLSPVAWIGLVSVVAVVLVALVGPWFAPDNPNISTSLPFAPPTHGHPFGFDYLGRDALSRFLSGGRTVLLISTLGYVIGGGAGLLFGLIAGYARGITDVVIARVSEILIGLPALVLMLLLIAGLGTGTWVLIASLVAVNAPRVTRIVRAAALEVRGRAFVEVAEARGERRSYILLKEMLPGVLPPFLVDGGIRVPGSILLVAGLSFLGVGVQPPASDWGLIISENRAALQIQPWAVVAPLVALALLMIGVNLVIDGTHRRSLGVGISDAGAHDVNI